MKLIALRRTKDQQIDGKPILILPSKIEETVLLTQSPTEREYYSKIHQVSKRYFESLVKSKTVLNNYVNLLEAILRMRQAATHRSLITDESWFKKLEDKQCGFGGLNREQAEDVLDMLKSTGTDYCTFCNLKSTSSSFIGGEKWNLLISPCGHPYIFSF